MDGWTPGGSARLIPESLSFFVVHGSTIRRVDVPGAFRGPTQPGVVASRAVDGRVALNLRTGRTVEDAVQTALLLDPATGTTSVLRADLLGDGERGSELLVADGDRRRWLVVTPRLDAREDEHDAVRLTTVPLDGED